MSIYYSQSIIHGFGVFTNKKIKKDKIISSDPVILIPTKELKHLDKTILAKYYFEFEVWDTFGAYNFEFVIIYKSRKN